MRQNLTKVRIFAIAIAIVIRYRNREFSSNEYDYEHDSDKDLNVLDNIESVQKKSEFTSYRHFVRLECNFELTHKFILKDIKLKIRDLKTFGKYYIFDCKMV